jgi:hypothetical protein
MISFTMSVEGYTAEDVYSLAAVVISRRANSTKPRLLLEIICALLVSLQLSKAWVTAFRFRMFTDAICNLGCAGIRNGSPGWRLQWGARGSRRCRFPGS